MKLAFLLISPIIITTLVAKEMFSADKMSQYLTMDNPFVYATVGDEYIYKAREKFFLGDFDAKVLVKYDKKDYPVSDGEFFKTGLQKPIENGIEFSVDYRKAIGTQEYDNIKTGEEGEVRLGVKIPVFSVINDISERKLNLHAASLDTIKYKFNSKDNFRLLYFKIISNYNKLLYSKAILTLEQNLLNKAQARELMIKKRVKAGDLEEMALLEANQQTINREQRLALSQNDFSIGLVDLLKYLNLSVETFQEQYSVPSMPVVIYENMDVEMAISKAIKNRPDIKMLEYDMKKINLQKQYANLLQYPNLNVSLYGVHDFKYENGFKIALDMDFPIQRRKYQGKYEENKKRMQNIRNDNEMKISKIKANLTNIFSSLQNIAINIGSSQAEVELVEKLERLESKKYKLGLSSLFMVNQREISTLDVNKKLLKYNLDYIILQEIVNKEIGESFETNKI